MDGLFGNFIEKGFDMRSPRALRLGCDEAVEKRADIDCPRPGRVNCAQDEIDPL